jgi:hypothetical protein
MIDELDDTCGDGGGCKVSIMCPVCGGRLSDQLPDKEGVLTELFRTAENTRIVNADVIIERDFDHVRDEEDENFPLDTPHPLVAVCRLVFDGAGVCTAFDIEEVQARVMGG